MSYNTLIDAFAEGGKFEKSWELFDEMRSIQLKPDLYTYASLIKGLKSFPSQKKTLEKQWRSSNLLNQAAAKI